MQLSFMDAAVFCGYQSSWLRIYCFCIYYVIETKTLSYSWQNETIEMKGDYVQQNWKMNLKVILCNNSLDMFGRHCVWADYITWSFNCTWLITSFSFSRGLSPCVNPPSVDRCRNTRSGGRCNPADCRSLAAGLNQQFGALWRLV